MHACAHVLMCSQTAYLAHYITLYDGASTSDPLLSRFTGAIGQLSTAVRSASSRTDRRCHDDRLHLEQRLRFARRMRSLLKLIRNMSCAVGDFQILPDIPPSVWQAAQRDYLDGFAELIQHDAEGVYIPSATLMAELPGATPQEK